MVLSSYNFSYKRFQQKGAYDGYEILKNTCSIQNYFNGTIITTDVNLNATFHKPTTVQTCLPHLDHENIALSASNITTLFFSTTAIWLCNDGTTNKKNSSHCRCFDSFNNSTINFLVFFVDVLLFCFWFQWRSIVWAAGYRIATTDDGAAMWRGCVDDPFSFEKRGICLRISFGWLLVVFMKCFSHCNSCLFSWWIRWEHDANGAAMWRIFLLVLPWIQSD